MRYFYILLAVIVFPLSANTISLSLKNAPTAEVIGYLAEETGKNVILADDIRETKNLRLENSHFDQILQSIAKINQLVIKQENNIYYISEKKIITPMSLQMYNFYQN